MRFTSIERAPGAFQQTVTAEQMEAICKRAFGADVQVEEAEELGSGLYNNIYKVKIQGQNPLILRVAPHNARVQGDGVLMMRNGYACKPFLAPIAHLLPRTIMVDFTQQVIERDYSFETFMEGERWDEIFTDLTAEENSALWYQLGEITRAIHAVRGQHFGSLSPGSQFDSWSQATLHWLTDIIASLERVELDSSDLQIIRDTARTHCAWLDEIKQPRLLHGDLWLVNILVKRSPEGPRITAILDPDYTSWGDPLADWTIFLMRFNAPPEAASFWQTYGQLASSTLVEFRRFIYQGAFLGAARLEKHRHNNHQGVQRSYHDMQTTITTLQSIVATQEG